MWTLSLGAPPLIKTRQARYIVNCKINYNVKCAYDTLQLKKESLHKSIKKYSCNIDLLIYRHNFEVNNCTFFKKMQLFVKKNGFLVGKNEKMV